MTQFFISEVRRLPNGEYENYTHYAFDEDATVAQLKAESKYHDIMSKAADNVANGTLAMHSAILHSDEGFPLMHGCYKA